MRQIPLADPLETKRIQDWIAQHGAPGKPCDECGLVHLEGERAHVATAETRFGHLLFSVCERCKDSKTPNIREKAERFMDRFVSDEAVQILMAERVTVN